MNERLIEIRRAEEHSHNEIYSTFELFAPGSWLAKPVRTVLELLPLFDGASSFCALDLGCGVGRNSIPIAQYFQNCLCRVDCVDILSSAIDKLQQNAQRYGVAASIRGYATAIEEFPVPAGRYDLILAVSALEHVSDKKRFTAVLQAIRSGLRAGGIACLIVNTNVTEHDKISGVPLPPQFEVTLSADEFFQIVDRIFSGCWILKRSIVHQKYDIPRENRIAALEPVYSKAAACKAPRLFSLSFYIQEEFYAFALIPCVVFKFFHKEIILWKFANTKFTTKPKFYPCMLR